MSTLTYIYILRYKIYFIRVIKHSHNEDSTLYQTPRIHQSNFSLSSNQHQGFHYETRSKQDGGKGTVFEQKMWIRSKYLI